MQALITGASSGIGRVFAERLARDGYDLIVVARREALLCDLARRLESAHGVRVVVLPADLSQPDEIRKVADVIEQTSDLAMLVNNAGFGTTGLFTEVDSHTQIAMVNVHVTATMQLTRAALPQMIAQRSGSIINVSSIAAFMRNPQRVNYCATKAYVNAFTESLHEEVKDKGISVQALCPGFTYTGFHDTEEFAKFERTSVPRFIWMRAEDVVELSLRALGKRKPIYIPGWQNRLIVTALRLPPVRWLLRLRTARRG